MRLPLSNFTLHRFSHCPGIGMSVFSTTAAAHRYPCTLIFRDLALEPYADGYISSGTMQTGTQVQALGGDRRTYTIQVAIQRREACDYVHPLASRMVGTYAIYKEDGSALEPVRLSCDCCRRRVHLAGHEA